MMSNSISTSSPDDFTNASPGTLEGETKKKQKKSHSNAKDIIESNTSCINQLLDDISNSIVESMESKKEVMELEGELKKAVMELARAKIQFLKKITVQKTEFDNKKLAMVERNLQSAERNLQLAKRNSKFDILLQIKKDAYEDYKNESDPELKTILKEIFVAACNKMKMFLNSEV